MHAEMACRGQWLPQRRHRCRHRRRPPKPPLTCCPVQSWMNLAKVSAIGAALAAGAALRYRRSLPLPAAAALWHTAAAGAVVSLCSTRLLARRCVLVTGKDPGSGRIGWGRFLLLGPYHVGVRCAHWLYLLTSGEPRHSRIADCEQGHQPNAARSCLLVPGAALAPASRVVWEPAAPPGLPPLLPISSSAIVLSSLRSPRLARALPGLLAPARRGPAARRRRAAGRDQRAAHAGEQQSCILKRPRRSGMEMHLQLLAGCLLAPCNEALRAKHWLRLLPSRSAPTAPLLSPPPHRCPLPRTRTCQAGRRRAWQ